MIGASRTSRRSAPGALTRSPGSPRPHRLSCTVARVARRRAVGRRPAAGRRAPRGLHGRAVDAPAGGRARRPARAARRHGRCAHTAASARAAARHPPRQRLHAEPARQPGRADPDRPHPARRLRHPDRAARPGPSPRSAPSRSGSCAPGWPTCRAAPRSPSARRCSCSATPPPTRRRGGRSGWPRRSRRTCLGQYAIIGLDRRGTGTDTLDCADGSARTSLIDADPSRWTPPSCWSGPARSCRPATSRWTASSAVSPAKPRPTTSRRSASALGVTRLSAVGTGDGAAALADWARAHPRAVGRLVLDGPPDPAVDEPGRSEARAKSTEATFDAFAQRCTSRSACPLGADPRTTVTALVSVVARPAVDHSRRTAAHREHGGDGDPGGARRAHDVGGVGRRVARGPGGRPGRPPRRARPDPRPARAATTPRWPTTATTRRTGSRPPRSRTSPGSGRRRTRCSGAASRPT